MKKAAFFNVCFLFSVLIFSFSLFIISYSNYNNAISTESSDYIKVCGIYIDGEFVCAAENKSNCEKALDEILNSNVDNSASFESVSFTEEIELIEGLYPENEKNIFNKKELSEFFSGTHSPVNIRKTKIVTRNEAIPFEREEKESDELEKGTKKVLKKGVNGTVTVTERVTVIDGKEEERTTISKQITSNAQKEIVLVGTKVYSSQESGYTWPTKGAYSISSPYGKRDAIISGYAFHGGVDIIEENGNSSGLPVIAAASGTVIQAENGYYDYGHTVVIDHKNGIKTRYAHMLEGSILVKVGDKIEIGQQLGRIGATGNTTGPHLHFEILINDKKVDPMPYIK